LLSLTVLFKIGKSFLRFSKEDSVLCNF